MKIMESKSSGLLCIMVKEWMENQSQWVPGGTQVVARRVFIDNGSSNKQKTEVAKIKGIKVIWRHLVQMTLPNSYTYCSNRLMSLQIKNKRFYMFHTFCLLRQKVNNILWRFLSTTVKFFFKILFKTVLIFWKNMLYDDFISLRTL